MRHLSRNLLILILLSGCAAPQLATTESGERANLIWIETDDAPEEAFRKIGRLLAADGYEIGESSDALLTIQTQPREVQGAHRIRVNVAVLEDPTRVQLIGTLVPVAPFPEIRLEAHGVEGSLSRRAWEEMGRVSSLYGGGTVRYERGRP